VQEPWWWAYTSMNLQGGFCKLCPPGGIRHSLFERKHHPATTQGRLNPPRHSTDCSFVAYVFLVLCSMNIIADVVQGAAIKLLVYCTAALHSNHCCRVLSSRWPWSWSSSLRPGSRS
jgi:hypothetical protein